MTISLEVAKGLIEELVELNKRWDEIEQKQEVLSQHGIRSREYKKQYRRLCVLLTSAISDSRSIELRAQPEPAQFDLEIENTENTSNGHEAEVNDILQEVNTMAKSEKKQFKERYRNLESILGSAARTPRRDGGGELPRISGGLLPRC